MLASWHERAFTLDPRLRLSLDASRPQAPGQALCRLYVRNTAGSILPLSIYFRQSFHVGRYKCPRV